MTLITTKEVDKKLRSLKKVDANALRAVCKDLAKAMYDLPARKVISWGLELVELATPGAHGIAYELFRHHPEVMSKITERDLKRYGRDMEGWGDVDCFSMVSGLAWRKGRIGDDVIHKWAASTSRWWRRAALVSTVPLNMRSHGGEGDPDRTFAVCRLLLDDRDDMVEKAMSWALRALAVREPKLVKRFVDENEDRLAKRAIREVRNKLKSGRKDGKPGRLIPGKKA